jgi:hypothetical protein
VSGPEAALGAAILSLLAEDASVRAALGDPLRVSEAGEGRPAYPYLDVAQHVSEPRDSADAEASEHRVDLYMLSRAGGPRAAREAVTAARAALRNGTLAMQGWRCILLAPAFTDLMWLRAGNISAPTCACGRLSSPGRGSGQQTWPVCPVFP